MKVWLKRVLISLVVLFIVALVGAAIFLLTFDPNAYKSKLEEIVYNRYQRTLAIKGDLQLSLFPRIGLSVQDVSLSNRDSTDTFASIDSARFAVAIWPLLSNRLVVDHVAVTGFKAWVKRDENGHFNFRDLMERQPVLATMAAPAIAATELSGMVPATDVLPSSEASAIGSVLLASSGKPGAATDFQIDIAGLDLKNGEIHMYDNITGSSARIVKLDVNTGRMTFDQAFDVALKGNLMGDFPVASANIEAQALVKLNPDQKAYSAQKLNLLMTGKVGAFKEGSITVRGNLAYSAYSQMFSASALEFIMKGNVDGKTPIKGLDTTLTVPQLKVDRSQAELRVDKLAYRAKGSLPNETFDIAFDAPSLSVSPEAAKGEPITGTVKLAGKDQTLGVALGMSGIGGNASKLSLKELKIDGGLKKEKRLVQLKMTSPANWDVFEEKGGLSAMKGDIRIEDEALPGGSFEFPFIGSLQTDLYKDELISEINAVLSGSKLDFRVKATQLTQPRIDFSLAADKLDFNTLFPPIPAPANAAPQSSEGGQASQAKAPAPSPAKPPSPPARPETMDLSVLETANLSGTINIGDLVVHDLKAKQFAASLRAAEGKLTVSGIQANLYEGKLSGTLTADAQNAIGVDLSLSDIALGPFLQDAMKENRLMGRGTVSAKLRSQGATTPALEAGLTGLVQARVRDGAVRGINVAQTLREANDVVRNVFSGQLPEVATRFDTSRQTDFTALDADIDFQQGQGTVKKLSVQSPLLRVTQGSPASIDLVNDQLDVLLNVRVVNTKTGQDGKELEDLQNVTVPVRVSGAFNDLGYQVQWKEISSKVVKEAVKEGLIEMLDNKIGIPQPPAAPADEAAPESRRPDPVKSIGDALKGLLGK